MATTQVMTVTVRSQAFEAGQAIPHKYTGEGEDVSPPLRWSGVPAQAKSLAMIVDDPDAPTNEPFVHWVIYNIGPQAQSLHEGIEKAERPASPAGAAQGVNNQDAAGYMGPMPPKGHGVHHYHFRLYALDADLALAPGLTKAKLLAAIKSHVIAEGEIVGTYERK
jgi:Raf kinase inhibitor-like YbhB/YbcL family protein